MTTDSHAQNDVQNMPEAGTPRAVATDTHRHLAMLRILYGASATALEAFRAADNPVDDQLVADLETMVERTKNEIERLTTHLTKPAT